MLLEYQLGPLGTITPLSAILICVGIGFIGHALYLFFKVMISTFLVPGKPITSFGPKGSWALITGASDGIGKQYALQIAGKGYNVILASRTQSKLDAISSEITGKYPGTKVLTIAIDFAAPTDKNYADLKSLLTDKRLAILVNNVGVSHDIPVNFTDMDSKEMDTIIKVNCYATLRVTEIALPFMRPYKNGLILNMGSAGGLTPTAMLSVYSGSKAFLQQWSSAIASELEEEGITVFLVHAYLVTSGMSKIKRTNWMIPNEKTFVEATLKKIGCQTGSLGYEFTGSPYWGHAVTLAYLIYFIGVYSRKLADYNLKIHKDVRTKALKRRERDAKKQ